MDVQGVVERACEVKPNSVRNFRFAAGTPSPISWTVTRGRHG